MTLKRNPPTRIVDSLAEEGRRIQVMHVGLAHEKLAPHNTQADKKKQARFIRNLAANSPVPPAYGDAFRRFVRRTPNHSGPNFGRRIRVVESQGRVLCGLGELTPTENGLAVHQTWGVPYLPGSSLKGIAKAWLRDTVVEGPWSVEGQLYKDVFGTSAGNDDGGVSGLVSLLDALWIPGDSKLPPNPFAAEILTPHFGDYLQHKTSRDGSPVMPDGTQSPKPITFLAAQGGFRLVVEGPSKLVDAVMGIVVEALEKRGIGAKSRSGYGRFRAWPENQLTRQDGFEDEARAERKAEAARAAAYANATTISGMLDALRHDDPNRDSRSEIAAWLGRRDHALERLTTFEITPSNAREAMAWALSNDAASGLLKKVRETVSEDILRAISDTGSAGPSGDGSSTFGPNHLDSFDDPVSLSKKRAKAWPNTFATRIENGAFDESTVRRAIAHLEKHGGSPGHVAKITRKYGLEDETSD